MGHCDGQQPGGKEARPHGHQGDATHTNGKNEESRAAEHCQRREAMGSLTMRWGR